MSTRPTLTNNIDANVDTINTNANNDDINTICKAWNNTDIIIIGKMLKIVFLSKKWLFM